MSQPIYRPVPDGPISDSNGLYIEATPDGWLLKFGENGPHVSFSGALRLCAPVEGSDAPPVPIDDIERILREHDIAYGWRRASNLLVRRVQRWLDAIQNKDPEP